MQMSDGNLTLHIIVKGKVQGIGYRASAKHIAEKTGVRGSVRNLSDGSVEVYAQGDEKSTRQFVEELKNLKGIAQVDNFSVESYQSPKEYPDFKIVF